MEDYQLGFKMKEVERAYEEFSWKQCPAQLVNGKKDTRCTQQIGHDGFHINALGQKFNGDEF